MAFMKGMNLTSCSSEHGLRFLQALPIVLMAIPKPTTVVTKKSKE